MACIRGPRISYRKPYSRATTIIEVNKDDPSDNDSANSNGRPLASDDIKDEVQTDVNILQTDDGLALAVIKKLDLINQPSFKKVIDSAEKDKPLDEAPRTRDKAVDLFQRRLKIDSPPNTRLITITFKSSDPVLAANITNTLARTFIDGTLARRQRSMERASTWLEHELGISRNRWRNPNRSLRTTSETRVWLASS